MLVKGKLFALLFLVWPLTTLGARQLDVVFNEVAWMGSADSPQKEWIELFNNTQTAINLTGWKIISRDGSPNIILKGDLSPLGFYLLERTDDNTVLGIKADQIYTGPLENQGENLALTDGKDRLIDEIKGDKNWPAGDNVKKQTMERKNALVLGSNPGAWQNSKLAGGTPKEKNALNAPAPTTAPPRTDSVIFNEIMPSPSGQDEKEEWIELFNQGDQLVDLTGWQIADLFGKTKKYVFPPGAAVPPLEYLVLKRPETKIILNNQKDGLSLISPDGEVIDTLNYINAPRAKSLARLSDKWFWTESSSPGKKNIAGKSEISQELQKTAAVAAPENANEALKNNVLFLKTLSLAFLTASFPAIMTFLLKH